MDLERSLPMTTLPADNRLTIAGVVFLVAGSVAILGALLEWRRDRRLRAVGGRTDGAVTRMRCDRQGREYPVVSFRTLDGRCFEVDSHFGTSPPMYRAGDPVRVLYDPSDPQHARIDRAAFGAGRIALGLGVGTIFAVLAVALLIAA